MKPHFFLLSFFLPLFISAQVIEISDWNFRKSGDVKWLPAKVPGCVHTDLFRNKLIPDPLLEDNEKKIQWIEDEDWEYETNFTYFKENLDYDHIEMVFEGLDTYAKVYLNDSLILTADNMFRSWNIEVKKYLKAGKNRLHILFESAPGIEQAKAKKINYTLPDNQRIFTRKAAFQYGWDFAPRFVTCGIWKNVKIKKWDIAKIENCNVKQYFQNDSSVILQFECKIGSDISANLSLDFIGNKIPTQLVHQNIKSKIGDSIYSFSFRIKKPKLWWCNGMGEANLYGFRLMLIHEQKFISAYDLQIGIRTLELVKEKDSKGESFYFKLNGIPVFMKGANCVPSDIFTYRSYYKSKRDEVILNAKNANMNMLRIWGGGVYPDDEFYNSCDENGILVWQDLMFAGAMYPGDFHFTENVKEEIKQQVIRLRNHPSLALWCGNNEIDEAWKNWDWQKQFQLSQNDSMKIWNDYINLFQNIIPEIIAEIDSSRSNLYWQSSPSIGWGHKESLLSGDSHYWGVWWGNEKFDAYPKNVGRFMSEYGFQGMPSINSIKKFVDTVDLNFRNEFLKNHQKHAHGFDYINAAINDEYKTVDNFEKNIILSQLVQAKGMKTAIEAHRRAKPYCMGTLFWQLNDCWPSISWSAIDYYGNRKALYYQAKRSFDNLLISFNEAANGIEIYVVSDNMKTVSGKLEIRLFDMNGKLLWWESSTTINFAPNSSDLRYLLEKQVFEKYNKNEIVLSCSIISDDKTELANSLFYFTRDGDLQLPKPALKLVKKDEHTFSVSSDMVSKDVYIQLSDDEIKLSDNFFDLLPGKEKTIKIEETKTFSEIEKKIKITTLYELMK